MSARHPNATRSRLFANLRRCMSSARPRVLFVRPPTEDYLADGLFHGLRTLLGANAVEYPKHEAMYTSYPAERKAGLYGRGFTLYGLLDDIEVDREKPFERAVDGDFDLVVFADIWRVFGEFVQLGPALAGAGARAAVVDTADRVEMYPYAGEWWRKPAWWFLPRAHTRFPYFKRELTPDTTFFRYFMVFPRVAVGRLPIPRGVSPIAFSIPREKVVAEPQPKTKQLVSHIVDPDVARAVGAEANRYTFATEPEYYADLRASRFGVTTKRAGWDALRHYELAANGCVPCFRDLTRKPALCAPHGLGERNAIVYSDATELLTRLETIDDAAYEELQRGAARCAHANSTETRAQEFLAQLGFGAGERAEPPR